MNEAVGLSFTAPLPTVELYLTNSTDFATVDSTAMTRIYNEDISWSEGAFNHVKIEEDPADYGWGTYDFTSHQVNGSRIYIIKLRNGDFKKIEIQSLISGIYTFRYANLDGSNEETHTIDKADYDGKTLAYFSIENGTAQDLEPVQWDLVFTRYQTVLFCLLYTSPSPRD